VVSQPTATDPKIRQELYAKRCKDLNTHLLSGRDRHLAEGIDINDSFIDGDPLRADSYRVPIRSYVPALHTGGGNGIVGKDIVIYYHGGGIYVGDLDSEDITCRRICKELGCTVYSVDYRLMPKFTADDAFNDAMQAFRGITKVEKARRLVVMGSSSGGQLAAMVSQEHRLQPQPLLPGSTRHEIKIHGVVLRGPVTCDATNGGVTIPVRFRKFHTSMSPAFYTSLFGSAAVTAENRVTGLMPLEGDLSNLPRHWIQVSTNDVYYSDGVLYAEALKEAGVEVKLDVVVGYPHTFWLKAPELNRAIQAEHDMIAGLKWVLQSGV